MAYTNHPAACDLDLFRQALGHRRWEWGVAPQWEYDTTIYRLEAPDRVIETLEKDLGHAKHEGATSRAEAVPTNRPGDMGETLVLRYRLLCPRTFD
jgi:hypothetical protein